MGNSKQKKNEEEVAEIPRRNMLYFRRIGLIAPVWSVVTIEKVEEWSDVSARMLPKIVINHNLEPTERIPLGERKMVFSKSEQRDKAFEEIISVLENYNVDFICVG